MQSESIKELAAALSKAQGLFDHASKDVKNDFYKSKYADLASCIDAAKKPLSDNGLAVVQATEVIEGCLYLRTTLMHLSGEFIAGLYPIDPLKKDPQGFGSAMTYARRYTFCAITGIAADDDDGNSASAKPDKAQPAPKIEPPKDYNQDDFNKNFDSWADLIKSRKKSAEQIISFIQAKGKLSTEQVNKLMAVEHESNRR